MGLVVTFYSYKGGVGRTMALANIAIILANEGHKVLVVDWDLDSSGLYSYFNADNCEILPNRLENDDGLIQLLSNMVSPASEFKRNWRNYIHKVTLSDDRSFTFLSSGNKSASYTDKLYDFNWRDFYEKNDGAGHQFLQQLREEWKGQESGYDFVLIDSRTGLAESARICTVDMPDVLIPVFTSNNQSLEVAKVAKAFQESRQEHSTPLTVYPLPSCIEMGTGHREEEEWLDKFAESFGSFYRDGWLPIPTEREKQNELDDNEIKQILKHVAIPKIASFCFGEKLPALNEQLNSAFKKGYNLQGDVTRSYKITAHVISDNFRNLQWLADVTSAEAFEMSSQNPIIEDLQKHPRKRLSRKSTKPSINTPSTENTDSTESKSKYSKLAEAAIFFAIVLTSLASIQILGLGIINWIESLTNKNLQNRIIYYRVDDRSQSAERNAEFKNLQYKHCISRSILLKNNDIETVVEFSDRRKIRQKLTIKEPVESNKFCDYIKTKEILLGEGETGTFIIDLVEAILDWNEFNQTENSSSSTSKTIVTVLIHDEEASAIKDNSIDSKKKEYLKKLFEQASKKNIFLTIMPFKKDVADRLSAESNGLKNIKICHISRGEEIDTCLKETFNNARAFTNLK